MPKDSPLIIDAEPASRTVFREPPVRDFLGSSIPSSDLVPVLTRLRHLLPRPEAATAVRYVAGMTVAEGTIVRVAAVAEGKRASHTLRFVAGE